jgi:hypothetical protein
MNVFDELENNDFVKRMFEKDELIVIEPATQLDLMDIPKDVPMEIQQGEFRGPFKIVHGIDVRVEFKSDKETSIHQINATNYPGYAVSAIKSDDTNKMELTGTDICPASGAVGDDEKDATDPMPSLPDEVEGWPEDLQETFCIHTCWNNESGMSWEESDRTAIEDVKNSPEYLIYQKTMGVNC